MDLTEMGMEATDWIKVAQYREQWRLFWASKEPSVSKQNGEFHDVPKEQLLIVVFIINIIVYVLQCITALT
jgi:hypothetical protein